ncbi:DUF6427 family protein [Robertkochia flava]|uniref:DUF6427 family protein n=1 Tax=Robertkochia flava TaxID=3447986 RepID=UPI001CCF59F5|nr:DUF6427 family protein [Robertkochia marina]
MISSIFGRTKPINFVLLALFAFVFLICYYLLSVPGGLTLTLLPDLLLTVLLVTFTMLLIEFINRKNGLTKDNTYLSFFFLLYLCMFPKIFADVQVIISHIFVLLAFRRVISIKSGQEVRSKIFDASIWVFVAALFYSWSVVFLVLVFAGIFLYGVNYYKNLLVPFVAFLTVAILAVTYKLYMGDALLWSDFFDLTPTFSLDKYADLQFVLPLAFISAFGFVSVVYYFMKVSGRAYKARIPGWLIMIFLLLSGVVVALVESANTSELIFAGFPLCVMMANYLQSIKKKWLKELFLWLFLAVPLVVLFL